MTLPTLPVSDVVDVQIVMSPQAAALRDFGATLIIGTSDVIDVETRIRTYASTELPQIASDFGSTAPEYLAAVAFFSQSPQPGEVQIGRWAKTATSGLVKGAILTTAQQEISNFQIISSGSFDVTVDGELVSVSGVNLEAQSNLNGVASQVTTALQSKATCLWDGERFIIRSDTTGTVSTVSGITDTELTRALGLASGTTTVAGASAESLVDAINALIDRPSWYMAFLAAEYEDADALAASAVIEAAAPSRVIAYTLSDTAELNPDQTTSLGYKLKNAGYNHTITAYSSTNPAAAASILGRMTTVNFLGSNTTITLKFKQCPGVTAENLTLSQANALRENNINVFVAYDNGTAILQEGTMAGGWFIDERHGLDWLQNYVQTAVWNLLYTSTTKIGQDDEGSTQLVATVSEALEQGVRNNLISPGVWNSDGFGALKQGDTLSTGFYVYIQPLEEQSAAEREARQAPPIQCAVKLTGAIHFVDVTINVNR